MYQHVHIVTLALYMLDGHLHSVDTEDVAVKANELSPGRFTWKKYPDQINLEMVRVSLSDAKKDQNGRMVEGSGRTGWSLSEVGRKWAVKAIKSYKGADEWKRSDGRGGSVDERRWRTQRARIQTLGSYLKWTAGETLKLKEAQEVFRIDIYTTDQIRNLKVMRLMDLLGDDEEVGGFLEHAKAILDRQER